MRLSKELSIVLIAICAGVGCAHTEAQSEPAAAPQAAPQTLPAPEPRRPDVPYVPTPSEVVAEML